MDRRGLSEHCDRQSDNRQSNDRGVVALGIAYVPNTVPLKTRIRNITISVVLLAYGTFGVVTDNFVLPAKNGPLTLYGYPAWVMYGALLCLVTNLITVVVDHYDTRDNEGKYKAIDTFTRGTGWSLHFLALILSLIQHSQDYVCENREVLRVANPDFGTVAIAFNRYCALHDPSNAIEPLLQVAVISATSPLPIEVGNAARMNRTDIVHMHWNKRKLVIVYRLRQNAKLAKDLPGTRTDAPVPVELVQTMATVGVKANVIK